MTSSETTSATAARKALDAALAGGKAALCVTDAASLPWTGLPKAFVGGGPHVVAVAGRDGDDFWIDDRAARPRRIGASSAGDGTGRVPPREKPPDDVRRRLSRDTTRGTRFAPPSRIPRSGTSSRQFPSPSGSTAGSRASTNGARCWWTRRTSGVGRRSSQTALALARGCKGCTSRSSASRRRRPAAGSMPSSSTMPPGRSRLRRSPRPLPTIVKQACCGPRLATWWPVATTRQSVRHAGSRTSASK